MKMTGGRPRGPEGCKVGALFSLLVSLGSLALNAGHRGQGRAKREGCS